MSHGLDLDSLFRPRSIAVVGASEKPGAIGCQVIENLRHHGYGGAIYPVNPKYARLHGLPGYGALADLPEVPDLVAVAVPAHGVVEVIRRAGEKGIPGAIVYASGFAETGSEGAALQDALRVAAAEAGVRLLGPNCQGVMNIIDGIHIGFGPPYRERYRRGAVSVVSQSGAFGNSLLIGMDAEGIGLKHYASTGNEADTGVLDLIGAMLADEGTRVIAGYVEGLSDGLALRRVALQALERGIPLVLWKVGTSKTGSEAAASHTANLAGDPACYRAVFDQLGIVRVNDVGDMADAIRGVQGGRHARGNRIGVVTLSGGAGVAMADRAEELGLALEPFQENTLVALRETLPAFASFANPLDVTAGVLASPEQLQTALNTVVADPNVDMLAIALAAASGEPALIAARTLAGIAAGSDMPIAVAWNARREQNEEALGILDAVGIPVFLTPGRAVRGLSAAWRFGNALSRRQDIERLQAVSGNAVPGPDLLLDEMASKAYLAGTGIAAPDEAKVDSADEAVRVAQRLGTPLVMKLLSSTVAHKSELGGVRLDLRDEDAIRDAFTTVSAIAAGLEVPGEVLLQQQVGSGIEAIVGARIDAVFGPMVMVGAGGVLAEIVSDVTFRLAPFSEAEARDVIDRTRLSVLLHGVRGRAPADREALARALSALSETIAAPGTALRELEVNPLFVLGAGRGAVAGDCVARVRRATG